MNSIKVKLFYYLKEKAGTGELIVNIPSSTRISDLKRILIKKYPPLKPHLSNILILINQSIALDEDLIPADSEISFMTPIGGG